MTTTYSCHCCGDDIPENAVTRYEDGERVMVCDYCADHWGPPIRTLNLDFTGFDWNDYRRGEREILAPQLHELGYLLMSWQDGDGDSFGPLTRVAIVQDRSGKTWRYVYG